MKNFRILEEKYLSHSEYWVQKCFSIFKIRTPWEKTTIAYFSEEQAAQKRLQDLVGKCNSKNQSSTILAKKIFKTKSQ